MKINWKASIYNEYLGELSKDSWVVYNNLSGALIELNQKLYEMLLNGCLEKLTKPDHINILSSRKIIVPKEINEVEIIQQERKKHIHNVTAIGLQILPTLFCNFSCSYCFERHPDHFTVMPKKVMDGIVTHLKRKITPSTRFLSVMWFGGEPLLSVDRIQYLSRCFLDICDKNSIQYYGAISTNGYLLNRQNTRILKENRVTLCQVTLDGPAYIHDKRRMLKNGGKTWRTIIDNLKYVVAEGIKLTVRMNVDKTNINSVEEFVEDLSKHGLKENIRMSLGVVTNQGNPCRDLENTILTVSQINEIVKQKNLESLLNSNYRKLRRVKPDFIGCVAVARNSIIVGPEGEIYKCPKVVGNNAESCGSIFQFDEGHHNFRKWEFADNLSQDKCKKCSMSPICKGTGCAYDYTIEKKNIFDCDYKRIHNSYRNELIQYYKQRVIQTNKQKQEEKDEQL